MDELFTQKSENNDIPINRWWMYALLILISCTALCLLIYKTYQTSIKNDKPAVATSTLVHIKMVKPSWPGFVIPALAYELGYFKEEGIAIDYIDLPDGADIFDELRKGNVDVQGTLSTQYLSNIRNTNSIDSRIVLLTDYSNGGDAIIARKGAPDLKSKNIKKIAGIEDYEFFLPYSLELLDVDEKTVKYVSIPADQERVDKLLSGEIDYAVTYDPYLSQAVGKGAQVIFTSSDKPGILTDVLLFSNRLIEKKPEIVKAYVRAYFKAYDFWRDYPLQSYKTVYSFYKYLPEDFEKQMKRVKLLSLDENIDAMSVNAGFNSVFGNLQVEQSYLIERNGGRSFPLEAMIYSNALRGLVRDTKLIKNE